MAAFLGIILALLPAYLWRLKIWGIPTTFLELLIVGFLLVVFIKHLVAEDFSLPSIGGKLKLSATLHWVIFFFLIAAVISTVISPEPIKAMGQLKAFIVEPILLFYATLLTVKTEADLKIILRPLLFSAGLISLFGLVQYLTHLGLPLRFWGQELEPKRIISVFDYPNALALYLAPLFVFYFALRLKKYNLINPQLLTAILVVMAAALYLTFSRGAWLAVIITVVILLFRSYAYKKAVVISMVILLLLAFTTPIRERLVVKDASSLAHFDLWQAAITKLAQNPVLGNGLYGFRTTLASQNFPGEILNYPHNILLNFWLELGLLGLFSFLAILYLAYKQYQKQPTVLRLAIMVFLVTIIIHGLVDVPYFKNDLSVLFWFMIAISYSASSEALLQN